jgi:hypothetical protein
MNAGGQILGMQRMGANPLEGGVAFEVVSADPRIAGLDRQLGTGVRVGAVTYLKTGTGNSDWIRLGKRSSKEIYISKALALLGDPDDYSEFFDDVYVDTDPSRSWVKTVGGSGAFSPTAVAAQAGGMGRFTTGATGTSTAEAAISTGFVAAVSTSLWYVASRFRIQTAVDNVATVGAGILNAAGNKSLMVGFFGALDAANFVVQFDGLRAGTAVSLGVAVDTNFHVFEIYGLGDSKVRARIDGGTAVVSGAFASAPADFCKGYVSARNNATAANRNLDVDWFLSVGTRM